MPNVSYTQPLCNIKRQNLQNQYFNMKEMKLVNLTILMLGVIFLISCEKEPELSVVHYNYNDIQAYRGDTISLKTSNFDNGIARVVISNSNNETIKELDCEILLTHLDSLRFIVTKISAIKIL